MTLGLKLEEGQQGHCRFPDVCNVHCSGDSDRRGSQISPFHSPGGGARAGWRGGLKYTVKASVTCLEWLSACEMIGDIQPLTVVSSTTFVHMGGACGYFVPAPQETLLNRGTIGFSCVYFLNNLHLF